MDGAGTKDLIEPSVAHITRGAMGELSPGERKVARALLATYPVAGLETAAELAQRSSVSTPTVVRFVARLGFEGYAAFQRALMREVHAQMGSPLEQYAQREAVPGGDELLPYLAKTLAATVDATFAELPPSELERALELLVAAQTSVHVVGGRFSHVLADYLVAHLQLLRPHVSAVSGTEFARTSLVSDVTRNDVLVVFDYRRYDPATARLAAEFAAAGGCVVLFTDPWLSPVAEVATAVLPSRVESPSPFDALTGAFALVEALITTLTERLGEQGRRRVETTEAIRAALDPHTPSPLSPGCNRSFFT